LGAVLAATHTHTCPQTVADCRLRPPGAAAAAPCIPPVASTAPCSLAVRSKSAHAMPCLTPTAVLTPCADACVPHDPHRPSCLVSYGSALTEPATCTQRNGGQTAQGTVRMPHMPNSCARSKHACHATLFLPATGVVCTHVPDNRGVCLCLCGGLCERAQGLWRNTHPRACPVKQAITPSTCKPPTARSPSVLCACTVHWASWG
jgi:hypothetical protein